MTVCNENEQPTFEALRNEQYVRHFHEFGLLQLVIHPVLGVSPDCMLILEGNTPFDGQVGYVVINTRVKAATVTKVEEARGEYGREVCCTFDDGRLTKCVPKKTVIRLYIKQQLRTHLLGCL